MDMDIAACCARVGISKLVTRRRGGFCYEHNGLFAVVLRELGFTVDLLEARVGGIPGRTACSGTT